MTTTDRPLLWLDPATLRPDLAAPPRSDDAEELAGLAATIGRYGVLHPLGVRPVADGYQIVWGSRRRAAAVQAGIGAVPCVEVDGDEHRAAVLQLLENSARRDPSPIEYATGLRRLRDEETPEAPPVHVQVGLSARTVARYLGLLELPAAVQALVGDRKLPIGHAAELRGLDEQRAVALAVHAAEHGLAQPAFAAATAALKADPVRTVAEALALSAIGRPAVTVLPAQEAGDGDGGAWGDEEDEAPFAGARASWAAPGEASGFGSIEAENDLPGGYDDEQGDGRKKGKGRGQGGGSETGEVWGGGAEDDGGYADDGGFTGHVPGPLSDSEGSGKGMTPKKIESLVDKLVGAFDPDALDNLLARRPAAGAPLRDVHASLVGFLRAFEGVLLAHRVIDTADTAAGE